MPTSITLQQLQYFLSAVEHGSLSAAAEAHFIAQPSLSEQIRRLENQLGTALFVRTNRKLILTEAAQMLIPHAQRTLAAAEEAAQAVSPIRNLTGGTVAFGTFSSAHHFLHTDLVADFRALHPLVSIRLVGLNSVSVADGVRDGELEAGLVALPVDDRGLHVSDVQWVAEAVYLSRERSRVSGNHVDSAGRGGRTDTAGGPVGRHGPHPTTAADTGAERWCVNQANCGGGLAGGGSRARRTRGGRYRDHSSLGPRSRLDQVAVLEFSRAAAVRDIRFHHATRCPSLARDSGADKTGKAASCPVTALLSTARRRTLNPPDSESPPRTDR